MDQTERIEQFRKMAKANPDDDLAHYAFGQSLIDGGRHAEAVNVLRHVIKLNATYSRAYVLLGQAQFVTGDTDTAVSTWQTGYAAAMNRGDLMPANEMKGLLADQGAKPDMDLMVVGIDEPHPDDDQEPEDDELRCKRSGRIGKRLASAPFPDEVGDWILGHISAASWEDWIEMSIKVINELRLDLGDPNGQRTYDDHLRDYLKIPETLFRDKTYD